MKIFVSSTYKDLKSYREAVRRAIKRSNHEAIVMEHFEASTDSAKKESLRLVEEADVFFGIYARRYGYIPAGETISITEQEYRHARKKGKPIYCFIVDPGYKGWPKDKIEQNAKARAKLVNLLIDIKDTHLTKFFKTKDDLVSNITPILYRLTDSRSNLQYWRDKFSDLNPEKKLNLLNEISKEPRLNIRALKKATKLIASNFEAQNYFESTSFVDLTGELLEKYYTLAESDDDIIPEFVAKANNLTKRGWQNWLTENLYTILPVTAIVFLLIGLTIGILSYTLNILDVRSTFIAPENAYKIDVIDWLVNKQARKFMDIDSVSNPGTQRALNALSFAYELDPKSPEIQNYIEKHISDIQSIASTRMATDDFLRENMIKLKAICEIVHYEPACTEAAALNKRIARLADSTRAIVLLTQLQKQWQNPSIKDSVLLAGYTNLLDSFSVFTDAESLKKDTARSRESLALFAEQLKLQKNDTLTVTQSLAYWEQFTELQPRKNPATKHAQAEIKKRLNTINASATIVDENDFVTTTHVNRETLSHSGLKDVFPPGTVWVWARIRAPKPEKVTFVWYSKDKRFHTSTASIAASSTGYRVYFYKNYGPELQGQNEVRLYNGKNQLIARRVFWIGSKTAGKKS